jgi:Tol biopolymer transport system component
MLALAACAVLAPNAGAFPGVSGAIVFQSANRGGKNGTDLWLRSANGKLTDLTNGVGTNFEPAVSPDGTKVAFISNRDGVDSVYVMSIAGGPAKRLTRNTKNEEEPSWSPDGKQIVYVDGRVGHDELAVMNADGSGSHLITHTDPLADNEEPQWSPDGTKIIFATNTGFVYTMNADGTGLKKIATGDDPVWGTHPQQ